MSLRRDLEKEVAVLEKEINLLESRRTRSMAALVEALVSKVEPDENEMVYFRRYTADIEERRSRLIDILVRLKHMP